MNEPGNATQPRAAAWLQYLSLFSSFGTLLCCAVPSLFVLAGLGATVASALSAAPWLVALSHHKNWTFAVAGLLILANILYLRVLAPRLRSAQCVEGDGACDTAARVNNVLLWISAAIYAVGFFVAFLLGPILTWIDKSQ
jgi:mercuric ion transport protein